MGETYRVRVQGDLYHPRLIEGAIYMGRAVPGLRTSPWHNPFSVRRFGLDESLLRFEGHLDDNPHLVERARRELTGCALGCWCALDARCHVDVVIRRMRGGAV